MLFYIAVPLLVFSLLFRYFHSTHNIRESWIYSSILWALCSYVITEFLSSFSSLDKLNTFGAWGIVAIILIAILHRYKISSFSIGDYTKNIFQKIRKNEKGTNILGMLIILILLTTFVIAIMSPSNTWDSMTYHLSRIEHWIQNGNINYYPTNITRQLSLSPLAEILILQLRILSGGDLFSNLIQWLAMLGSVIAVSSISQQFGLKRNWQIFTSFIAVTIPMGILQSSSTQNDYVVSFFIISFVYLLIKSYKNYEYSTVTLMAVALGLALLSKATSYVILTPFILWIPHLLKKKGIIGYSLLIVIIVLSLNLFQFQRNYALFNNILGDSSISRDTITASFTPPNIISNIIRNTSLHLGVSDRLQFLNTFSTNAIEKAHGLLNVETNDKSTTFGNTKFKINTFNTDEDIAGNFVHTILICIVVFSWPFIRSKKISTLYLISFTISFLLFNGLLRWQPWGSRLQLPLFVIASPLVTYSIYNIRHSKNIQYIIISLLLISTFYYLFFNDSRPLIGPNSVLRKDREELVYVKQPAFRTSTDDVVKYLVENDYRNIGIYTSGDTWEYPYWYKLRKSYGDNFRLEHINVSNASSQIYLDFVPDAVVCFVCDEQSIVEPFNQELDFSGVKVFVHYKL